MVVDLSKMFVSASGPSRPVGQVSGWQPIETAPKNPAGEFYGPTILVWCKADGMPWPAYWGPGGPDNEGCWHIASGGGKDSEIWPDDATHWMQLPSNPNEKD